MLVKYDFDLTKYNGYRVKSICKKAFFPEKENDIIEILKNSKNVNIIGNGNNIILSKEKYDEDFLIFNNEYGTYSINDHTIVACSGINSKVLSEVALNNELAGLEIFYDIPGSLGGIVYMNAGSKEESISDLIQKVEIIDSKNMKKYIFNNKEIKFDYRFSIFQNEKNLIISKVWINLKSGRYHEIKNKMINNKNEREKKQPREYPNCGSVFRRPKGYYVGPMIEEVGLKGYKIGGAKVSEKHCGFIINFDGANGEDIIKLINEIKSKIYKKYNIKIDLEQIII